MGVLVVIWLIVGVVGLIAKSDFLGFVFLLIASGLAFLLFYSGTEGDWIVALVAAGLPFGSSAMAMPEKVVGHFSSGC